MTDAFPQLRKLAYVRLDQDWDLIHPDPDGHVRDVVRYDGVAAARALLAELEAVRNEALSDADAESWWGQDLRSGFNPMLLGITYSEWFDRMERVLKDALQGLPPTP